MQEKQYLTVREEEKYTSITLNVPIDMNRCGAVEQGIAIALKKNNRAIALNFSNTQHIFSAGMGLIARVNIQCIAFGVKLYLTALSPKVLLALEDVGLTSIIHCFSSEIELKKFLETSPLL